MPRALSVLFFRASPIKLFFVSAGRCVCPTIIRHNPTYLSESPNSVSKYVLGVKRCYDLCVPHADESTSRAYSRLIFQGCAKRAQQDVCLARI